MLYVYTENVTLHIIYYVHAYLMHLLLIFTCQGQEGTSLLIVGLNAVGDVWCEAGFVSRSPALLGLAQRRRIYSMVRSPPGVKEASSSYSSRLSH